MKNAPHTPICRFLTATFLLLLFSIGTPPSGQHASAGALRDDPNTEIILAPGSEADLSALPAGGVSGPTESPTLVSPADGATTTGASDPPLGLPLLKWQEVSGATRYHVQVSASAGFAATEVDKDTYATNFAPDKALADGAHYWRVKAFSGTAWGEYSEAWSFYKDWSDGGAIRPAPLSPPEGVTRASFSPADFTWAPVPGAATYRFEISADPAFSNPIYSAITIKARHTPVDRLPNNLYYWRVTPIDRQGNGGAASEISSFTFDWSYAPELLGPEDSVDLAFLPRFSWTAVEAAREYRLEISTQPDFSTSVNGYSTDHTDYTPERTLANDQDYYWRVRATDYRGTNGPWSAVRKFRMRWNFQTQLLTPQNSAIRTSYPFFSWIPIPGSERYQAEFAHFEHAFIWRVLLARSNAPVRPGNRALDSGQTVRETVHLANTREPGTG